MIIKDQKTKKRITKKKNIYIENELLNANIVLDPHLKNTKTIIIRYHNEFEEKGNDKFRFVVNRLDHVDYRIVECKQFVDQVGGCLNKERIEGFLSRSNGKAKNITFIGAINGEMFG